jgi:hypothetical protein
MKCAVQMGSGVMIYIPSFIKMGSDLQKLMEWDTNSQTASRLHKPTFTFFKNEDRKLKIPLFIYL